MEFDMLFENLMTDSNSTGWVDGGNYSLLERNRNRKELYITKGGRRSDTVFLVYNHADGRAYIQCDFNTAVNKWIIFAAVFPGKDKISKLWTLDMIGDKETAMSKVEELKSMDYQKMAVLLTMRNSV